MKQTLIFISILFLASCGAKYRPETKLVRILYRVGPGAPLVYSDSAMYTIRKVRELPEDSTSTTAVFVVDTSWSIKAPDNKDTIRGKDKRPLLDSATHSFQFNQKWFNLSPSEKKLVKIQVITI
jgi:hypothetical protein